MNKTTLNSQKEKHSMLSLRRATRAVTVPDNGLAFLSTLSLRRATIHGLAFALRLYTISIHALLAESDVADAQTGAQFSQFLSTLSLRRATRAEPPTAGPAAISIHALLAESDVKRICFNAQIPEFLSTLSLRRATRPAPRGRRGHADFYPRSPCGERRPR